MEEGKYVSFDMLKKIEKVMGDAETVIETAQKLNDLICDILAFSDMSDADKAKYTSKFFAITLDNMKEYCERRIEDEDKGCRD